MFAMDSDREVHKYIGKKPIAHIGQSREVIEFIRGQYKEFSIGRWAIMEKAFSDFVSWTGHKRTTETVNGHTGHIDFGYRLAYPVLGTRLRHISRAEGVAIRNRYIKA
jgi:hypothetical protein